MSRAAAEIFCHVDAAVEAGTRTAKTLRCTCRGFPDDEGWEETAQTCVLHQLCNVDGGVEGRHWPWPWRGKTEVTEVVVPRTRVHGGAAFAGYVRWRRAVTMRTRFFLEHQYYHANGG